MMSEFANCDNNYLVDKQGRLNGMTGVTIDHPAIPISPKKNKGKQPKIKMNSELKPHEETFHTTTFLGYPTYDTWPGTDWRSLSLDKVLPEKDQKLKVFVELHELERSRMQWEQKARWIKYEQNAEGGLNRWGKPHIAHMSFQSLIELKKKLEKGSLLLDLNETDPSQIFHCIVDDLAKSGQIPDSAKTDVMRALLYEHKHVEEGQGILRGMSKIRRNTGTNRRKLVRSRSHGLSQIRSSNRSDQFSSQSGKSSIGLPTEETGSGDATVHFSNGGSTDIRMPILNGMDGETGGGGLMRHGATNHLDDFELEDITRLGIPPDAEATTVFVGQLTSLEKPAVCLVRLHESSPMSALTEVNLPVRFLLLILGPVGDKLDYHELGRCFGTLMASEQFSETAYKTDNIGAMISAMNDFIDDTVVLPAGNWDKDLLLPVLRIQNEKVKERKLRQEIARRWADPSSKTLSLEMSNGTPMQKMGNRADDIDPLVRVGIPFGGMINDIKRRYPRYLSDFKDALNGQCLAAVIFIFFAALAPAITFGGLLGEKTDNWLGISEMIVSTSIAGIIFALFSAQPLCIIGVTGPILVFEENLYKFCVSMDIEYLPFRFWVGSWMFIIAIICVAVEGSVLVRFFTRFTTDIFAFLISIIFIYEVFNKLYQIFSIHPLVNLEEYCDEAFTDEFEVNVSAYIAHPNGTILGPVTDGVLVPVTEGVTATLAAATAKMATTAAASLWPAWPPVLPTNSKPHQEVVTTTAMFTTLFSNESDFGNGTGANVCGGKTVAPTNEPNTALLSTLLMLGTFLLANAFKIFKTSHYFGKTARKLTCDFGIPLSIIIMVGKDMLITGVYTQKLDVPNGLVPTDGCKRGWFVNPMGMEKAMPVMWIFCAALPALLAFILMFMESLITSLIVNKKDNKLKKGSGFHLDMFILGGLCMLNGIFGLPWVWAATVRSVTHTGALSVYSKGAPGEKPRLEMIMEQRLTSLLVALLIGLSIALAPLLKQVPLAVLFGVFLYMGVSSLNGIQFAERVFMLVMPVKHHLDEKYVRGVRTWRMHLFTIIQLLCVVMLWVVKISPAALAFPFFLIVLMPIRGQLKRIFSTEELEALDCDEADDPLDDDDD